MKRQFVNNLFALTIISFVFSSCVPTLIDISPDKDNGVSDGTAQTNSTAGLVLNMAGDKNGLYAVALNAGVWKTQLNIGGTFDKWVQLSQSPRYAHCIAVDPNSSNHIVVGERRSDAIGDNNCGFWESFDGGITFKNERISLIAPCRYNIINAIAITDKSTILISTPNGIGRKATSDIAFTYPADVSAQNVTAIATFKNWIVARTKTTIFISNNDGVDWEDHDIQLNYIGQIFTQDYAGSRGGEYSVAILQDPQTNNVYVYVPVTRNPNSPCIGTDNGTGPCKLKPDVPPTCNYGSFVVFDNQTGKKSWNYQIITGRGLGLALGGRAFMRSFFSSNSTLQKSVGGNTNLVYCCAQNLFKASSVNADGTANWVNIGNYNNGCEPAPTGFHSDIWDYLIDPSGSHAWVGTDGGVFQTEMKPDQTTVALSTNNPYVNLNSGLHTQHIHSSFVTYQPARFFKRNGEAYEFYSYGTQDNGGWKKWITGFYNVQASIDNTTDANIAEGDQANTLTVIGRHFKSVRLEQLNENSSSKKLLNITINNNLRSGSFQFIQTMVGETEPVDGDVVMLTITPFQYVIGNTATNIDLGQTIADNTLIIIRNKNFGQNPDINTSKGVGWNVEFSELRAGAQAVWVSGGHADPTYFLLCEQSGRLILFKRKKTDSDWVQVPGTDALKINRYVIGTDIDGNPIRLQHGPVYVNPYNTEMIYISCEDGIYRYVKAVKGGPSFKKDIGLTNLVSGNGKYPIDKFFSGGNSTNVTWASQANNMCPLSCVAFDRFHPDQVVASSPFTGVFFKNGTKRWKDLSAVLPKPITPVSSVNFSNKGIYVTTEGRGFLLIQNY